MAKILLVEDNPSISYLIQFQLEHDKHQIDSLTNGLEAVSRLEVVAYDLIILDWLLPDVSGVNICKQFRERGGHTPIMMLTGKAAPEDKAIGLDAGADDYIVKPVHPVELQARVRALLRRASMPRGKLLRVRDVEINALTCQVRRAGKQIDLRPKEFALLEFLMKHPNQSFSAESILSRLWRSESATSVDSVRTHIKRLRCKLEDTEQNPLIRSTRNLGYRIVDF